MDGLILTAGVIVVMAIAFVILGRTWPRSSRLGGYRARPTDGSTTAPPGAGQPGVSIREDDDARWRWDGGADGGADADAAGEGGGQNVRDSADRR